MNTAAKGVTGEREVADLFEAAGFEVRGLESSGDWLIVQKDGRVVHVEVKRHERPRWGEWIKQAESDCPEGVPLMVACRRNRQPWYVMQRLEYVIAREARIAELEDTLSQALAVTELTLQRAERGTNGR